MRVAGPVSMVPFLEETELNTETRVVLRDDFKVFFYREDIIFFESTDNSTATREANINRSGKFVLTFPTRQIAFILKTIELTQELNRKS